MATNSASASRWSIRKCTPRSEVRGPKSRTKLEIRSNRQSSIGNRQLLDGRFVLTGKNQIGFQVAAYDHRAPLVIDPVLVYSTYLGGSGSDASNGMAVDASGSVYVIGTTTSPDFPLPTRCKRP